MLKGGLTSMEAIQAYYNGSVFVPLAPVKAKLNQQALITIVGTVKANSSVKRYSEFYGSLSSESYLEIIKALKDTERIDLDEW